MANNLNYIYNLSMDKSNYLKINQNCVKYKYYNINIKNENATDYLSYKNKNIDEKVHVFVIKNLFTLIKYWFLKHFGNNWTEVCLYQKDDFNSNEPKKSIKVLIDNKDIIKHRTAHPIKAIETIFQYALYPKFQKLHVSLNIVEEREEEEAQTSISSIPVPSLQDIPIPQKSVEPRQVCGPSLPAVHSPSLNDIQKAALEGDLAQASMLLDKYQTHGKKAPLTEADICEAFEITDTTIGKDWKGICTVGYYNEDVLLADEDEGVNAAIQHTELFLNTTSPRGFLFFKQQDQTCHPLRKNEKGNIEIFNKITKQWEPYTQEQLKELQLRPNDLCICLGRFVLPMGAGVRKPMPTEKAERYNKYFYHESQGPNSGGFCAIHAANQFIGKHAIDIADFYTFARKDIIKTLELTPEGIYKLDADVADVRAGADPAMIMKFLEHQATLGIIEQRYAKLQCVNVKCNDKWNEEILAKIPSNCDRVIIAYGGSHFATLRKDETINKWFLVDSMAEDSQDKPYDTLEDAIKQPDRAITSTITLIY